MFPRQIPKDVHVTSTIVAALMPASWAHDTAHVKRVADAPLEVQYLGVQQSLLFGFQKECLLAAWKMSIGIKTQDYEAQMCVIIKKSSFFISGPILKTMSPLSHHMTISLKGCG